ncbi:hypothetical protein GCM10023172_23200 [Hymenobacter ginsengisoli]|uniref:VCBS repeat-containing protein n=1 Tax=Hymenobacter ginsengisoli TaxID=1051626 RepID=A0ABP8QGA1_9BACT|nr:MULTISPECIES: hypothetical protein [unclassified Hymenobacter]MBO2031917.1 hypothetical protein [Hymenobacter sp. BT559]
MKKPTIWQQESLLGTLGLLAASPASTTWPLTGTQFATPAALAPLSQEQPTPIQRTEAQTLALGLVQRRPGEADSTFLRRVLPVSYPASYQRLSYAWRPSAFGKQLFFVVAGTGSDWYLSFLFVLYPFQTNTYTVQQLTPVVDAACDQPTNVSAILFADVNQDGQKELIALGSCSSLEPSEDDEGKTMYGHVGHQGAVVFRYAGLDHAGRPHYEDAPTPPYLNELETAGEVRAELAAHQRRRKLAPSRPVPKRR